MRIEYENGAVDEADQGHMRGGIEEPLTREEIDAKFRANVAFGGHGDVGALLDACSRIGRMSGGRELVAELAK